MAGPFRSSFTAALNDLLFPLSQGGSLAMKDIAGCTGRLFIYCTYIYGSRPAADVLHCVYNKVNVPKKVIRYIHSIT